MRRVCGQPDLKYSRVLFFVVTASLTLFVSTVNFAFPRFLRRTGAIFAIWAWQVCAFGLERCAACRVGGDSLQTKKLDSVQLLQRENGSKKGNVDTQTRL